MMLAKYTIKIIMVMIKMILNNIEVQYIIIIRLFAMSINFNSNNKDDVYLVFLCVFFQSQNGKKKNNNKTFKFK
jgi:hypothetical protein